MKKDYFDLSTDAVKKLPEKPSVVLLRDKFAEIETIVTQAENLVKNTRNRVDMVLNANFLRLNTGRKIDSGSSWDHALDALFFVYAAIREKAYDDLDEQLLLHLHLVLDERVEQLKLEYVAHCSHLEAHHLDRSIRKGLAYIQEVKAESIQALQRLPGFIKRSKFPSKPRKPAKISVPTCGEAK